MKKTKESVKPKELTELRIKSNANNKFGCQFFIMIMPWEPLKFDKNSVIKFTQGTKPVIQFQAKINTLFRYESVYTIPGYFHFMNSGDGDFEKNIQRFVNFYTAQFSDMANTRFGVYLFEKI